MGSGWIDSAPVGIANRRETIAAALAGETDDIRDPRDQAKPDDAVEQDQDADDAYDPVEEAGWESFPASDPPAWTVASRRK